MLSQIMGCILGSWGAESYILLRCVGLSHQPPSLVFTQPNKYLNRLVIPMPTEVHRSASRYAVAYFLLLFSISLVSVLLRQHEGFKSLGVLNVFSETSTLYLDFCYEIVPCKLSWIFSLKIFSGFRVRHPYWAVCGQRTDSHHCT